MPTPFDGVTRFSKFHPSIHSAAAKIGRADKHLQDLDLALEAFEQSDCYRPIAHIETDGNTFARWYFTLQVDAPPVEIGLIAGDVLTNLRASLDHCMWALKRQEAPESDRPGVFPMEQVSPHADVRERRRLLAAERPLLRSRAISVLEPLQPYNATKRAREHPLSILTSLVNADKHKVITSTGLKVAATGFSATYDYEDPPLPPSIKRKMDEVSAVWPFQRETRDGIGASVSYGPGTYLKDGDQLLGTNGFYHVDMSADVDHGMGSGSYVDISTPVEDRVSRIRHEITQVAKVNMDLDVTPEVIASDWPERPLRQHLEIVRDCVLHVIAICSKATM